MKRFKIVWMCMILALTVAISSHVSAQDGEIIINPGHVVGSVSIAGYQLTSIVVKASDTQGAYTAQIIESVTTGADSIEYELVVEADMDYHVMVEATVLTDGYTKAILPVSDPVPIPKYFNPGDEVTVDITMDPAIISGTIATPNDSNSIIESVSATATTFLPETEAAFSSSNSHYNLSVPGTTGANYTLLVVPGMEYTWHVSAGIDGASYSSAHENVMAPAAGEILDKDYIIEETVGGETSVISGTTMLQGIDVYTASVSGSSTEPPVRSDSVIVEDLATGLYSLDETDSDTWKLKSQYSYYLPGDLNHLTGQLTTGYTLVDQDDDRSAVDFIIDPAFIPGSISLTGANVDFSNATLRGYSLTDGAKGSSKVDPETGRFVYVLTPGDWRYANTLYMSFDYPDDANPDLRSTIVAYSVSTETQTVTAGQTTADMNLAFETSVIKYYFSVDGQGTLSNPYITVRSTEGSFSSATGYGATYPDNKGLAMVTLLKPGEYEIEAFATVDDSRMSFGKITTYVAPGVVVVVGDTEGPSVKVTRPADEEVVCEDTTTIEGVATDDVGVASITINGTSVQFVSTQNPDDANEVSFLYEMDLPMVGDNIADIVVTDEENQEPATLSHTVIREICATEMPSVKVFRPVDKEVVCAETITVEGIASDDFGVASITINGTSVQFFSTQNPDDVNEVSFLYEMDLPMIGNNTLDVNVRDEDNLEPTTLSLTVVREKCTPEALECAVDIKPTSCPNPLNMGSKGVLPVAILGTPELDVSTIDPNSIRILGVAPIRMAYEDVSRPYYPFIGKMDQLSCHTLGGDGHMDLTLKFDRQDIIAAIEQAFQDEIVNGDVLALPLTAYLYEEFGGNEIFGEDVVVIRKKGKKNRNHIKTDPADITAERKAAIMADQKGMEYSVKIFDSWSSGYCAKVNVTNTNDETRDMPYGAHFTLPEDTRFDSHWNGDISREGENVTVIFRDWADPIGPGRKAPKPFGYCVKGESKPVNFDHFVPDFSEVEVGYEVSAKWSTGYCARLAFTYNGDAKYNVHPRKVRFTLPQSTKIGDTWSGEFSRTGDTVTVDIPFWAQDLSPGTTETTGGFCAFSNKLPSDFVILQ